MKKKLFLTLFGLFATFANVNAQTYQIGHVQITYTDPARGGRSIQTEIYYPTTTAGTSVPVSAGQFPLIVFGHGFVMTWDAYQNIWNDLVPQGYILAFPRTEGSFSPNHLEFGKDLAFLVTKMQNESATNSSSLFYNHINFKSAIMGHSMGGGSSFLAAKNNTNITTMVSMAAANTTPSAITAAQNITVPCLVFSGQNDCVAPANQHQTPMYDSLISNCKTFISVKGGAHCEFANFNANCSFGQSTCTPAPAITGAQQKDVVSDFLKLWLEYYLKDICNSRNIFNDSLVASPRINYLQSCINNSNPVISQTGSVLQSTLATTYQWYLNGNPIAGANSQTYNFTLSGNYYVEVTYADACPYVSNTISITITNIQESSIQDNVLIYPNPANDYLIINWEIYSGVNTTLEITNVLGKQLYFEQLIGSKSGSNSKKIDISQYESGIYFIQLNSETFYKVEKVLKK